MLIKNPNEENDFVTGHTICINEGRRWIQRFTKSYGLILTLDGTGSLAIGESKLPVKAGDLLLLKPHRQHLFQSEDHWNLLWFHFLPRPHIGHVLEWPDIIPGAGGVTLEHAEFQTVQNALFEAHHLEFQRLSGWHTLACLLLESVIARGYNWGIWRSSGVDGWLHLAQRLLTETTKDMDEIATCCHISRATLYTKFKNMTGVSPRQYREYAMLRNATRLLENRSLSIAEVARQAGMPDPYYFSTRFHKFTGFSPREYRRRLFPAIPGQSTAASAP